MYIAVGWWCLVLPHHCIPIWVLPNSGIRNWYHRSCSSRMDDAPNRNRCRNLEAWNWSTSSSVVPWTPSEHHFRNWTVEISPAFFTVVTHMHLTRPHFWPCNSIGLLRYIMTLRTDRPDCRRICRTIHPIPDFRYYPTCQLCNLLAVSD